MSDLLLHAGSRALALGGNHGSMRPTRRRSIFPQANEHFPGAAGIPVPKATLRPRVARRRTAGGGVYGSCQHTSHVRNEPNWFPSTNIGSTNTPAVSSPATRTFRLGRLITGSDSGGCIHGSVNAACRSATSKTRSGICENSVGWMLLRRNSHEFRYEAIQQGVRKMAH